MTRYPVPKLVVRRPRSPIVIDGRMTEKAWQAIPPVPLKETKEDPPHDPVLHHARLACDGRNLYVVIVSDIPDRKRFHPDGEAWDKHDWATVCLQGATDDGMTPVYNLSGYASGKLRCETYVQGKHIPQPELDKHVRFAASVGDNQWTAEWQIPLAQLGISFGKLKQFRFNAGVRQSEPVNRNRKWGMWLYTGREAWDVQHAGLLEVKLR